MREREREIEKMQEAHQCSCVLVARRNAIGQLIVSMLSTNGRRELSYLIGKERREEKKKQQ